MSILYYYISRKSMPVTHIAGCTRLLSLLSLAVRTPAGPFLLPFFGRACMIEKVYINVRGFNHVQNKRCTWGGRVVRHRSDPVFIGPQPLYAGISALVGVVHPRRQPGQTHRRKRGRSRPAADRHCRWRCPGPAAVDAARHPPANRRPAHHRARAMEPGILPAGVLGVASTANLCGGLLVRLAGAEDAATLLPSGGAELFVQFLALCAVPAVVEELLFRGALQGLMRPSGSAAAIFGPALLFGAAASRPGPGADGLQLAGVFLGWLAERSQQFCPGC